MTEKNDAYQLTAALGQLLAQCRDANRVADEGDREPIMKGLVFFIEFVRSNPQLKHQGLEELFLKIGLALTELDYDNVHPLLQPKKKRQRGRNSKARRYELIECAAAATVSALIEIGFSREEAASVVMPCLRAHGFLAGRHGTKAVDPVTRVLGWRARLEEGPGRAFSEGAFEDPAVVYQQLKSEQAFECAALKGRIASGDLTQASAGAQLTAKLSSVLSRRSIVF